MTLIDLFVSVRENGVEPSITWRCTRTAVSSSAMSHSSTLNAVNPTLSANLTTAFRLVQIRNGSRRLRTGTKRAVGPPRRTESVHQGRCVNEFHGEFLSVAVTDHYVIQRRDQLAARFFIGPF